MLNPISNVPKYVWVADQIEAQIIKGKWEGGRMPSVRGIATQHNISVVTASRALQVLRDKGLIQTIERSGCYRVPPPSAEKWSIILRLTSGPWLRATDSLCRSGFEAVARRQPMHLSFDAFDLPANLTPAGAEQAAIQARNAGIQGVFMLPSRTDDESAKLDEIFLRGCFNIGMPTVLLERGLRGEHRAPDFDLVAMDDTGGAYTAIKHLQEIGRKRIGVVVASPTSSHNDRVAGYLFAIQKLGLNAAKRADDLHPVIIHEPEDVPTKDAYAYIANMIHSEKLDGILCYSDYTALGVLMELMQRGVKVPSDVAIIGFDNLPFSESLAIELTTVDYPAERMAEQALRLMRERLKDSERLPVKVVVPSKLIVRGSTVAKS